MREFELMFIVDGTMPEEEATAIAATVQSFISSKGTILKADPWGRRRMAYPITVSYTHLTLPTIYSV